MLLLTTSKAIKLFSILESEAKISEFKGKFISLAFV